MKQKTNETVSTRQKALAWWKKFNSSTKLKHWREYQKTTFTPSHSPDDLTGREIEEIWTKETQVNQDAIEMIQSLEDNMDMIEQDIKTLKLNQKQFRQFDESLFKAYIDKLPKNSLYFCKKIIDEKFIK